MYVTLLEQWRKDNNCTQEQLTESIEVGVRTIQRWESGESIPGRKNLIILSRLLDRKVDELKQDFTVASLSRKGIDVCSTVPTHKDANTIIALLIMIASLGAYVSGHTPAIIALLSATAYLYYADRMINKKIKES